MAKFLFFIYVTFSGTLSWALDSALKPQLGVPQQTVKIDDVKPESRTMRVVRDGGIGLGVGALGGLSFIMTTHGRLPNGTSQFDTEALATGLVTGLIGGVITGFWEVRHDPKFVKSD